MNINNLVLIICGVILTIFDIFQLPFMVPISITIILFIVSMFIYRNYKQLKLYNIILFLLSSLGFSLYIYTKAHFGVISSATTTSILQSSATQQFMMNKSSIAKLISSSTLIFSFIYGVSQVLGGYIISIWPNACAVISYILAGVVYLLIGCVKTPNMFSILYGSLAALCVLVNMNTSTCQSLHFKNDWFSCLSVFGISYACYLTCNVFLGITPLLSWGTHYTLFGCMFIGLGVLYAIISYLLKNCKKCTISSGEKIDSTNNAETSAQIDDVKPISKKEILALFVYSIVVVVPMYAIQGGFLKLTAGRDAFLSNSLYGILYILIPMFSFLSDKQMMLYSSIIGAGAVILSMITKNTLLLNLAVTGFTIWGVSHGVPPLIVGKRMKNAGSIFGLLNFGAMFIGCFCGQYLFSNYLSSTISIKIISLFISLVGIAFSCLLI